MAIKYHYQRGVKQTWGKPKVALVAFILVGVGAVALQPKITSKPGINPAVTGSVVTQAAQTPATIVETKTLNTPLPWPKSGLAAYSVPADKLTAASVKETKKVPVASLAKIITLLAVMKQKPLAAGEQGPTITIAAKDIQIYTEYVRKSGTVTQIAEGQKISQYQAMQAVMYASSNNMSDTLAIWAFGSLENYTEYSNNMLTELGLANTTVARDASGYSPETVSTAEDMAEISFQYLQNPVLREIAQKLQATLPFTGTLQNGNAFINQGDIFGLKAGNTDQAGKCFIVASIRKSSDQKDEISVAVVLGSDSVYRAATDAVSILKSGNKGHDKIPKN